MEIFSFSETLGEIKGSEGALQFMEALIHGNIKGDSVFNLFGSICAYVFLAKFSSLFSKNPVQRYCSQSGCKKLSGKFEKHDTKANLCNTKGFSSQSPLHLFWMCNITNTYTNDFLSMTILQRKEKVTPTPRKVQLLQYREIMDKLYVTLRRMDNIISAINAG